MNNIDPSKHHWFIGDGMVHGLLLGEGKAHWYRNRWVRSKRVSAALGEPPVLSDWPAEHVDFAANTNVIGHSGKTFALVEGGGSPMEMSFDLETIRASNLGGTLPQAFSAHPKLDPKSGELHVMTYWFGWGNQVQYLIVGVDGKVRRTVDIQLPGSPMLHDIAFTEKYILVFDLPCVFNMQMAMNGSNFPYCWDNNYQARIGLLPRLGSEHEIRWCEIDSCYIFHAMNAYDAPDGTVVLTAIRHDKMFSNEKRGPGEGPPTLDEWVLDPTTRSTRHRRLDDRPQEFPRIDERRNGLQNRFGYSAGVESGFVQSILIKHDLANSTSEIRNDGHRFGYGEPVFVPNHKSTREDEGWVMVLRHDLETDLSDFVIIDSQGFTDDPVAVVHLPVRVPNGFHGNWITAK